jgi:hypothetical protein
MIVRSRNPIRTVNTNVKPNNSFSFADGDDKKAKKGFFSKEKRTLRKDERKEKRAIRKGKREAKYGARPLIGMLKSGKKFFKDRLPSLKKKANGDFEKTLPDGKTVDVPKDQVQILPPPAGAPAGTQPLAVEKSELKTGGQIATENVNGEIIVTNTYSENQTEKAIGENGQEQVYKKADVVDADSSEAKKPMSTLVKVGIGVAATAVLGVIIYLIVRPKK